MTRVTHLIIPSNRLKDYLLNISHPKGSSKAKFFLARGFDRSDPDVLGNALAMQALNGWPGSELPVPSAMKYRITGPITCPDGRIANVLTVWKIDDGSTLALLLTARPAR